MDPANLFRSHLFSLENIWQKQQSYQKGDFSAETTRYRLYSMIVKLRTSSYFNLSVGVVANVFAFMIIFNQSLLFDYPTNASETQQTLFFVSKMLYILALEGVSIFFLNLYQKNIKEIRHMHHEITTIEQRSLAYQALVNQTTESQPFSDQQERALEKMLETDRRFEADSGNANGAEMKRAMSSVSSLVAELSKLIVEVRNLNK